MTIEKRAEEYASEHYLDNYHYSGLKEAYIAGAKEQKALMLDRLKERMNAMMLDTRVKEHLHEYLSKD